MNDSINYTITLLTSYEPDNVESGFGDPSQLLWFVFYIIVFLAVIALLFVVLKLLKKYSNNLGRGNHMRILDSLPLDNEKKLVLVEVGNKILLLGAGKEINLLTSVELNQEELQLIKETGDASTFSIQDLMHKIKDKLPFFSGNKTDQTEDMESFEQQLQEELNKMRRSKDEGGHDDGEG